MAVFLPEHLPAFAFDATGASLRLMPRPRHHVDTSDRPTSNDDQRLRKRRSVLSITLDHILPARSSPTKTSSEYHYTAARYSNDLEDTSQRYRCDILAVSSSDFASAETECKQLVVEAGGTIVNQQYPGGFLFDIADISDLPIETGDQTVGGGSIVVEAVDTDLLRQHIDLPPGIAAPEPKKWTVKSEHRLHKKPHDGRLSPFEELKHDRTPRFWHKDTRRVTLMEMLIEELEELEKRRRLEADGDWETLNGDEDA